MGVQAGAVEKSYRRQILEASATMLVMGVALAALSYVVAPSPAFAAVLGVACVAVLGAVLADLLPDRFGPVWLGLGLAAVVVYLSPTPERLRATALAFAGLAVANAVLWFVPAKAARFGERLGDRFR